MDHKIKSLIIKRDSREKKHRGWYYPNMEIVKLEAGDYSIKDLENIVSIERKDNIHELFCNLGTKKNKTRFYNELELLSKYKYKFIVVEATLAQLLCGSRFSVLSPSYVMELIHKIYCDYNIPTLFLDHGEYAQNYVGSLLEQIASKEFGIKTRLSDVETTPEVI